MLHEIDYSQNPQKFYTILEIEQYCPNSLVEILIVQFPGNHFYRVYQLDSSSKVINENEFEQTISDLIRV